MLSLDIYKDKRTTKFGIILNIFCEKCDKIEVISLSEDSDVSNRYCCPCGAYLPDSKNLLQDLRLRSLHFINKHMEN